MAFWIDLSSTSLKSLGLALPLCGFGVIVPTSVNPNPKVGIAVMYWAFLSNPAPKPTGL